MAGWEALLDDLAAAAMPATVTESLDGWVMRASPDLPFRRCSSVLPLAPAPGSLGARLATVDAFYDAHGLPVRYQMTPLASPTDLDSQLAARGFSVEAPVDILTAPCADVVAATATTSPTAPFEVRTVSRLHEEVAGIFGPRAQAYERLLRAQRLPVVVAVVRDDRHPVTIGIGVVDRGWLGIFGMQTLPEHRRRGGAATALHALARDARRHGATRCYLQVEVDNARAQALYAHAAFTRAYGYHYRRAPA